jgi:hypothetical protein
MANDLLDAVSESYPVNIDNMVEELPQTFSRIPEASIRNQAALTTLLSDDPEKVARNFQNMVNEAQQGASYTRDSIMRTANAQQQAHDKQGLMSILADPKLPIEAKRQAILNMGSDFNKDTASIVASQAAQAPSKGENPEQEHVRIMGAEQYRSVREARENKQKIINAEYAKADPSFGKLTADVAEHVLAPFATNKMAYGVLNDILGMLGQDEKRVLTAALPGTSIAQIREKLAAMPPQDRILVQNKIRDLVMSNPKIIYTNDNHYAKAQVLEAVLDGRDYSTFDKILDNTVGVLDVIGVGSLAKAGILQVTKLFTKSTASDAANVALRGVTSTTSPVSPIKVMEDTNPEKARGLYDLVVKSSGDSVSQAVAGTTRDVAIADAHLPQPAVVGGSVEAKLVDPDRNQKVIIPDAKILDEVDRFGASWFSENERLAVNANITHKLKDVTGITQLDNMTTVGTDGTNTIIKAMYGTSEGGFLKAETALAQTKFALREFGVTDRDLTLMVKRDNEYIPITLAEANGVDGNYLVQLNTKYAIGSKDITHFDTETVHWNWADRLPQLRSDTHGGLANHLVSNSVMLSPRYTGAAVVQTDKSVRIDKLLIESHDAYFRQLKSFDAARQVKVTEYLKEANAKGFELNTNELLARGFVKDEIDAINQYRRTWDTHFWFENADLGKTLSNQGYGVLESAAGDKFFAKAIPKNGNITQAYDPASNSLVKLDKVGLDALYSASGTYAKFKKPLTINGIEVEHMVVRNTPTEYIRAIKSHDQILEYRPGYTPTMYKAPKFIEETVRDAKGNVLYTKAREVAGDTKEAEHIKERLATAEGKPLTDFNVRDDIKDLKVDTDQYWDLMSVSGRVAQRHRGKRLEASGAPTGGFNHQYMLDPSEVAIRASRSLAGRIATRDMLEAAKARAMSQYGKYFPSDGMGGKQWVERSESLLAKDSKFSSDIADARTTVHYINYLEQGYINGIDEGFKSAMNAAANMMKDLSATGERAFLHLGDVNPTAIAKNGVFHAYLGLHPLRQFIVQGHQSVRLLGYDPVALMAAIKDAQDYATFIANPKHLAKASAEQKAMYAFIKETGSLAAVDKENLVRGALTDMAESSSWAAKTAGKLLAIPRRIGFDSGEKSQLFLTTATIRRKYMNAGKDVANPVVADEIRSLARAMSYDMNFAGDMPYNQNALGLFMQFFQVPHKAIMSMADRRIPQGVRMRMALTDAALFGIPGALALENMVGKNMLPEDAKAREVVLNGLVSRAYNGSLSITAGEDIKIDFSSLSPYGMDGFAHLAHAVVAGNMLEFAQNSPAFSFYMKDSSRVQEALGRMFRAFGFIDTKHGLEPETAESVIEGIAEISSGWNAWQKGELIRKMGTIPDKTGEGIPLSNNATAIYAMARKLGFANQQEAYEWAALKELNANDKKREDDYKKVYDSYIKVLTRDHKLKLDDPEAVNKVLGAMQLIYKDDFKAQEWFAKKLAKDLVSRKDTLMRRILEESKVVDADQNIAATRNLMSVDEYKNVLQLFDNQQEQIKAMRKDK